MTDVTPRLRVVSLPKVQCGATSRAGQPCKQPAIPGGTVCRYHGGSAPQVRAAAQRRLLSSGDALLTHLIGLATKAESEAVQLGACRDLLDRLGIGLRFEGDGGRRAGIGGGGAPGGGQDEAAGVVLPAGELTAALVAALEHTAALAERYWQRQASQAGSSGNVPLTVEAEVVPELGAGAQPEEEGQAGA